MWSTVLSHALKYLYYIEISRASASQAIPFKGFQPSSMNSLLEVHCPHANPPPVDWGCSTTHNKYRWWQHRQCLKKWRDPFLLTSPAALVSPFLTTLVTKHILKNPNTNILNWTYSYLTSGLSAGNIWFVNIDTIKVYTHKNLSIGW